MGYLFYLLTDRGCVTRSDVLDEPSVPSVDRGPGQRRRGRQRVGDHRSDAEAPPQDATRGQTGTQYRIRRLRGAPPLFSTSGQSLLALGRIAAGRARIF